MITRRLPVILFVSRFECPLYHVVCCLVCLWWPRRFLVLLRPTACHFFFFFFFFFFYDFFKVFSLLSSSHRLHRLSNTLTARDFIRVVMLTAFVITLANYHICQFAALLPLVTSLAIMHCDVLEPQPGVTTVKNPSVPGSGCSGPVSSGSFRFPP